MHPFRLLSLIALAATGCSAGATDAPEWNRAFQGSLEFGWSGGDAAYTVELPNRRVLWSFGDTLLSEVEDSQRLNAEHRFGNSVGVQSLDAGGLLPSRPDFHWGPPGSGGWLPIFADTLDSAQALDSARAAFDRGRPVIAWPLHGASIGSDLVLFHAPVTSGGCDDCGLFDFQVHGSTVSLLTGVDRPIDEWGATESGWPEDDRPDQTFVPFGDGDIWWGTAVLRDGSDVYIYGSRPAQMGRDVVVARVSGVDLGSKLLDFSAWRFWNGRVWTDSTDDAAAVVPSSAVEITVLEMPRAFGGGYAMVHGGATALDGTLSIATSAAPWGPFVETYSLPLADFLPDTEGSGAFIYAVKAHAAFTDSDDLLVSYIALPPESMTDPGVPLDSRYYVPRFVRVPWALVTDG